MTLKKLRAVVYDIETCDFTEASDFDISNQTITVAVTYDDENEFKEWEESEVSELVNYLLSFEKIIGFNIKGFDNRVLDEYEPGCGAELDAKSVDMMEVLEKRLGHRISLDSLVSATLNARKTADGAMAAQWAREGEYGRIAEYCTNDVELTKDAFLYGLENEEVYYDYRGDKRKVKVNWLNPDKRFSSTEFTYTLIDEENGRQMPLDPNNREFFQALELVRSTNRNLFITGKAGTGKTTFLKYVKSNVEKNTVVVAFTGVAAINAGGQTIHSFFQINPSEPPFTPWDNRLRTRKEKGDQDDTTIYSHFPYGKPKREILKSLELLIIDEVSMVRADFLDVIDKILRAFGPNKRQPFGGVQVLLIGDTFQLAPIEGNEWAILGDFYESHFFFSAQVFSEHRPLQIELKTIYRQNELEFINLLNRVRVNRPLPEDITLLNRRVRPLTNKDFDENYIVLSSTNAQVKQINESRLATLASSERVYNGVITGTFPEKSCATDLNLTLKEGAQVMILKNGPGYYNGKIGTVVSLDEESILVKLRNNLDEESVMSVEKHTWENVIYSFNPKTRKIDMEVIGTFTQYPLKLAWAITVHKSQGLTFEKVFVDIGTFAPSGLAYVALSRCTSLNGLALKQPITRQAINTDERVIAYAQDVAPESLMTEILSHGKADELYKSARRAILERDFREALSLFSTALKYRNDISTDAFTRYILWVLNSRSHYQYLVLKLRGDCNRNEHIKNSLTDELERLKKKFKKKDEDASSAIRRAEEISKQRSKDQDEIKRLLCECDRLSQRVNVLEVDKKQVVDTNGSLIKKALFADNHAQSVKKALNQTKDELTLIRKQLEEVKAAFENERIENSRLRKITWIQKLFGKK